MPLCCTSLAVTTFRAEERLVLVRAADAVRLCSEGSYQRDDSAPFNLWIDQFRRGKMGEVRRFLSHSRAASVPTYALDDAQVLTLLQGELKARNLVALRKSDGGQSSDAAEQRRLVREIHGKTGGRLHFAGRQYKLAADADLDSLPERDSYEVVHHDEAVRILDTLATQSGNGTSPLAVLLVKARGRLTRDWRAPMRPEGLILLRRNFTPLGTPNDEPALTPSQIKKLAGKTEWIEIEVVDELGKVYTGPYRVERPDGSVVEGRFDDEETELWGDYDIDPGKCKLTLPEIREVKPGTGTGQKTWIWVEVVDEEGNPAVGNGFRLKLTDGSERTGILGDDDISYDPIDAGTCELSLDPVGCDAEEDSEEPAREEDSPAEPLPEQEVSSPEVPTLPAIVAAQVLDAILTDDEGHPLPNQAFAADFGGGVVKEGQTDGAGAIHLEDCPSDQCTLTFLEFPARPGR
jgi:hypothetical protein